MAVYWECGECGYRAPRTQWEAHGTPVLEALQARVAAGEDLWVDDEMEVCPGCGFEHHDNDGPGILEVTR